MIKIIVDTLGGDNSPNANIEGAVAALKENADLSITFVGDKDVIAAKLTELGCGTERTEIVHAPDEISCNDKPTEAIRKKTDSSLYRAIELLKARKVLGALNIKEISEAEKANKQEVKEA